LIFTLKFLGEEVQNADLSDVAEPNIDVSEILEDVDEENVALVTRDANGNVKWWIEPAMELARMGIGLLSRRRGAKGKSSRRSFWVS